MGQTIVVQTSPIKLDASDSSLLDASYLKTYYLKGLELVDSSQEPWEDDFYEQHLRKAIRRFEHLTKIDVLRRIVTNEPHDYYVQDYQNFAFLQCFRWPVIDDVTNFPVTVTAVYPTGQTIITFPKEWVRLNGMHGQVQLVPTQGTLSQVILGQGGSFLPLIFGGLQYLPQLFQIQYTSGFADNTMPEDIVDAICKLWSIYVLTVGQDTVFPPGLTSMSSGIDGVSQGMGMLPGAFSVRINAYLAELFGDPKSGQTGMLQSLKEEYKGITMAVV